MVGGGLNHLVCEVHRHTYTHKNYVGGIYSFSSSKLYFIFSILSVFILSLPQFLSIYI